MDNKEIVEREAVPHTPTLDENRRETADINFVRDVCAFLRVKRIG